MRAIHAAADPSAPAGHHPGRGVVALFVFASSASPGNPAAIIAGDYATAQDIARIRASLGSTGSLPVQIGIWLEQLLRGDLGTDACLWR
jgi:peptide/nickel transport system permease protein